MISFKKIPRYFWSLSSVKFNFIYCLFTIAVYNIPFIKAVYLHDRSTAGTVLTVLSIFALLNIAVSILFIPRLVKPLAIFFCLLNTTGFYFMHAYGIVIDKIMLLNIIQTDVYEVQDMLNLRMLTDLLLFGILPSWLILKTKITFQPFKKDTTVKIISGTIFALITATIVGFGLWQNPEVLKERKYLKNSLIPVNGIGAVISVVKIKVNYIGIKLRKISVGAHTLPAAHNGKPNLIVVVIGESARDANFSLSGYNRPTNEPLIRQKDRLVYFDNFYSCGTATAVSLPCIFSPYPQKTFKPKSEKYYENVLDIIDHAGYKLLWRENNTNCMDNCNRIEQERFCNVKECADEILLKNFSTKIKSTSKPTMVVLHQRGSHGPLYALRYPPEFEIYKPVCQQKYLPNCTNEEIVNTYDNSIYYTSYMLSKTIDELKALSQEYDTALFFTSDHGESLGENGLYIHSTPYETAPDEQKHIPTLLWLSENYAESNGLDMDCIRKLSSQPFSHDNVFHTLLGMSLVATPFYDPALDMLNTCRKNPLPTFGRTTP